MLGDSISENKISILKELLIKAHSVETYDFLFLFFSQMKEIKKQYEELSKKILNQEIAFSGTELHNFRQSLKNSDSLQDLIELVEFLQIDYQGKAFAPINCPNKLTNPPLEILIQGGSFEAFSDALEKVVNQQINLLFINGYFTDYLDQVKSECLAQSSVEEIKDECLAQDSNSKASNGKAKTNPCCNLF